MSVQTIFDIIGSISLAIIAIFLCIIFFYLIKILRDISKITYQLREKGEIIAGVVSALVALVKKAVTKRKKKR